MPKRPMITLVAACMALILSGCSDRVEMGTVSGTVLSEKGEPLDSIRVYFMPNFEKQTEGRASWAITDELGNFTLEYQGGANEAGAAIGWHKVTLQDIAPENVRDGPPPAVRVPKIYNSPSSTPLEFEVLPGEQNAEFQLQEEEKKTRRLR